MTPHERVQAALDDLGLDSRVLVFEQSTATAQEAANACGCELGQIIKTLFFLAEGRPTVVLVAGDRHVDTGRVAALVGVGRKKLKMGSPGEVLEHTGFAVGGVSPVGLASPCDVVVDRSLERFEQVWAAAGEPNAVFPVATGRLIETIGGQWADVVRE